MDLSRQHFSHLRAAALSDIGRKRKNNEDAFGAFPGRGVWCVADGMGGGDDGEVASTAIVKAVDAFLADLPELTSGAYAGREILGGIVRSLSAASAWIFERARKKGLKGCGSTVVGVVFDPTNPGEATAFHVGDSRLYRLRGRELKQITKDHSVAEMMGAKDEAELNPMFRGMILRAVGIENAVEVETTPFSVRANDVVLICSDGLSRMVPDRQIVEIVRDAQGDAKAAVRRLVEAANAAGGVDNVTVELICVGELPEPASRMAMPAVSDVRTTATVSTQDVAAPSGEVRRTMSWRKVGILFGVCVAAVFAVIVGKALWQPASQMPVKEEEERPSAAVVSVATDAVSVATNAVAAVTNAVAAATNAVAVVTDAGDVRQELSTNDVQAAACATNGAPSVRKEAESEADRELKEAETLLKIQRERREREERAAAAREEESLRVAQSLVARETTDAFIDFANLVNKTLGSQTSERLQMLRRQLGFNKGDVRAADAAAAFTKEACSLCARICERESDGLEAGHSLPDRLREALARFSAMDPASVKGQRTLVRIMNAVSLFMRKEGYGRKR